MNKIIAISDTHNQHRLLDLPDGDILIHAGDLTGRGSTKELCEVFNWFRELANKYQDIIFIAGNHDFGLQGPWDNTLPMNVHYLQDSYIKIQGLKIYGSPWTPNFGNWTFMKDDRIELPKVWAKIPEDTDILITHGPPRDVLDLNQEKERCGSRALYNRIAKQKDLLLENLKVHIFGHIHESYGHIGKCYNVSVLNRRYELVNLPTIIEINNE